jgi:hypothetical protein
MSRKGMVRMFRKSVSFMVLLPILSLLFYSCACDDVTEPADGRGSVADDSGRLEEDLRETGELAELIAIRDEIALRALARNVTPQEVREAAGDPRRSNELLGYCEVEAKAINDRIAALVGALFEMYPALEGIEAHGESECAACDIERMAETWERYSKVLAAESGGSGELALEAPARAPLKCKMRQLVMGFGLCAMKSGGSLLFYSLCSYGVFCGSCSGGMADVICK